MRFCDRPFSHIHMDPDGPLRICSWTDESIGNLCSEEMDDIWHGEKVERIRESIRDGSFRYCRGASCPFLENNSLPDLDEAELNKRCVASDTPTSFNVACDRTCNHSCPSCRDQIFAGDRDYYDRLQIILDKALPYLNKANNISANGCGDLFSSKTMMNFLEKVRPEDEQCRITIETNGALFNQTNWKKIEHFGDYHLAVTVTPNSFEETTFKYLNGGHDSFKALIDNLYFIRELRRANKVNEYLISIVVQDRNFYELPEFAKRCIEDFEADQVIVKPLYKWFCLSEESYWIKDVLNPLHPYHPEFLKAMKNPYLDNEKIFFWNGRKMEHEPKLHPLSREKDYLEYTNKLLAKDDFGAGLLGYLDAHGIGKLYLYGDITFSEVIGRILIKQGVKITGYVARDTIRTTINGLSVTKLKDFREGKDCAVIVSNYHFYNVIKRDFDFFGITATLLSADKLIDELS